MSKTARTRDGRIATFSELPKSSFFLKFRDPFILRGHVGGAVHQWTAQGRWSHLGEHPLDLMLDNILTV